MRLVLLTVLLLLLAAPAAHAKSRLLAEPNGTVTIEWPERVCTQAGIEDAEPITFSLSEVDFDSPPPSDTPVDELDDESLDPEAAVDMTLWPLFPVRPWRVVYHSSGGYDTWHDLTCAVGDVQVEPVDPSARTVMRAARASHSARVKAVRDKTRRRGLGRLGQPASL